MILRGGVFPTGGGLGFTGAERKQIYGLSSALYRSPLLANQSTS